MVAQRLRYQLFLYLTVVCVVASNFTSTHIDGAAQDTSDNVDIVGAENDGDMLFIITFFDLLQYIIGLVAFCIFCLSCLVLFYIQQTRKREAKPVLRSVSLTDRDRDLEIGPTKVSGNPMHSANVTGSGSQTLNNSDSPKRSPRIVNGWRSRHTSNITYSNMSLSAFSGVDSEGIDVVDDAGYGTYNDHPAAALHPIPESIDNVKPFDSEEEEMLQQFNREESIHSSETSIETVNGNSILAMMRSRATRADGTDS